MADYEATDAAGLEERVATVIEELKTDVRDGIQNALDGFLTYLDAAGADLLGYVRRGGR